MGGLGVGRERAVLEAGAARAGRQARAAAVQRALLALAALRHRHLRPHGAPPRRTHRLIRYYKPAQQAEIRH